MIEPHMCASNGRWVTNAPRRKDARRLPMPGDPMTDSEYWQWRNQFAEGAPQGTDAYTSAQLSDMGMVGLYRVRPNLDTDFRTEG